MSNNILRITPEERDIINGRKNAGEFTMDELLYRKCEKERQIELLKVYRTKSRPHTETMIDFLDLRLWYEQMMEWKAEQLGL